MNGRRENLAVIAHRALPVALLAIVLLAGCEEPKASPNYPQPMTTRGAPVGYEMMMPSMDGPEHYVVKLNMPPRTPNRPAPTPPPPTESWWDKLWKPQPQPQPQPKAPENPAPTTRPIPPT